MFDYFGFFWDPAAKLRRREIQRLQARGVAACSLRVVAGSHPGLREKWKHGTGTFYAGSLHFQTRGAWRDTSPGQSSLSITVLRATRAKERELTRRERWAAEVWGTLILLRTPDAVLECGLREGAQRDWALTVLNGRVEQ